MFHSRIVSLALVGLFVWVTACSSYSVIPVGDVSDHGRVRVTLLDGERETIHDPWVQGDSIRSKDAESIPLDQIAGVETVGTDEVGTVFMVLGIAVVLAAAIVAIACSGQSDCFDLM